MPHLCLLCYAACFSHDTTHLGCVVPRAQYPPLTFLQPTGKVEVINVTPHTWGGGGRPVKFTVIEVEPQMS